MTEAIAAVQDVPIAPQVHMPEPGGAVPEVPQAPPPPAEKPTLDDALSKAFAKGEEAARKAAETAKAPAPEKDAPPAKDTKAEAPKVEAPAAKERAPDGKFMPKAADPQAEAPPAQPKPLPATDAHRDPPQRFNDAAKAEWATAPQSVRAEVQRMMTENERGIAKYREAAEQFESVRQYAEQARQNGGDLKGALDQYTGIERLLKQNPVAGLEQIVRNLNLRTSDGRTLTLHDVAAHIMGQTPDQRASAQNSTIASLQNEIETLKNKLSTVTTSIEQQQKNAAVEKVTAFQADHPRFEELADDIALLLESGRAKDLEEAYDLADRMNPSLSQPLRPATPPTAAQTGDQARPLNPAGQKSISGAPATASVDYTSATPKKGPTSSIDEALEKALRRASR